MNYYDLMLLPAMLAAPLISLMLKPWVKAGGKGRFVFAVGIAITPLCAFWALEPVAQGYVNHQGRCSWTQENWAMYNKRFQFGCELAGYEVIYPPKILPTDYRECENQMPNAYRLTSKQAREIYEGVLHRCAFDRAQQREPALPKVSNEEPKE